MLNFLTKFINADIQLLTNLIQFENLTRNQQNNLNLPNNLKFFLPIMRKFYSSIMLIAITTLQFPFILHADDAGNSDLEYPPKPKTDPIPMKPIPPMPQPTRPFSLTDQNIWCSYDGEGTLYFDFAIPEGDCTLTVVEEETGRIGRYSFDSECYPQVYVGPIWNATLLLDTSLGNSYEGWIGK